MFVADRRPMASGDEVAYCVKTGPHTYRGHFTDSGWYEGRVGCGDNPVYRVAALAEHEP